MVRYVLRFTSIFCLYAYIVIGAVNEPAAASLFGPVDTVYKDNPVGTAGYELSQIIFRCLVNILDGESSASNKVYGPKHAKGTHRYGRWQFVTTLLRFTTFHHSM